MMVFIWMCVMAQVFNPGGFPALQATAYEAHLRAQLETPPPASALLGAASHIAHMPTPKLAHAI